MYTLPSGASIQWPTGTLVPINAINKNGGEIVNALIIPVVAILPAPGFFESGLPRFLRRKNRLLGEDVFGSGSVSGSLDPPPQSPPPDGVVIVGDGPTNSKKFTISNPIIDYNVPIPV